MTLWEAMVLGLVQGATEFLPVSSSGHLVIGQALLGIRIPGVRFEVALHLATLFSVVLVYRQRIRQLVVGATLRKEGEARRYLGLILLATIPAAIAGVGFGDAVSSLFDLPWVVGVALLATGSLLFSARWAVRRSASRRIGARAALIIGAAQAFAVVPGVSRSGTTVVAALWLGVAPIEAAAFSFLMSIPAIAGAGFLQLLDLEPAGDSLPSIAVLIGSVAAATAGILAIRLFIAMLESRSFPAFGWYCWGAGLLFLAWVGLA